MFCDKSKFLKLFVGAAICISAFAIEVSAGDKSSMYPYSTDGKYIEPKYLFDILKSRNIDKIIETMNDIKKLANEKKILNVVIDLWAKNDEKYPDLPWDIITTDVVRLELADILIQAKKNRVIDLEISSMHTFVSRLIQGDDYRTKLQALLVLPLFNDPRDVPIILDVIKTPGSAWFRAGVRTLAAMCNDSAKAALDELEKSLADPKEKRIFIETRRFFESLEICR